MSKMKGFNLVTKIVAILSATIAVLFILLIFSILNARVIKWSTETIHIPKRPISHSELNKRPDDLKFAYSENLWFRDFLSKGQVRTIAKYMKKHNLLMAPGKYYIDVHYKEELLLRCFDYLDADTLEPVEFSP